LPPPVSSATLSTLPPGVAVPLAADYACEFHCLTVKFSYFLTSKIWRAAELRVVLLLHHLQTIIHLAVYRFALCSLSHWQRR